MNEPFAHKPRNTSWIGCVLFVAYDCENPPIDDGVEITGVEQFGFIISHQYKIVAKVAESRRLDCTRIDCEHGVRYEFDVRFSVFDVFGLGIGLGKGTGTLGIKFAPTHEMKRFVTECICCDPPRRILRATAIPKLRLGDSRPEPTATPAILALIATLVGVNALSHQDTPSSQIALLVLGVVTAISSVAAVYRSRGTWMRKPPSGPSSSDPTARTIASESAN